MNSVIISPGDTFFKGIIAKISVSVGGIKVSLTVSIFDELLSWFIVKSSEEVTLLGTPCVYVGISLKPLSLLQIVSPESSFCVGNKLVSNNFLKSGPPNLDCVFSTETSPLFNELAL